MIKRDVQAVLVNGVTVVQVRLCVHGHNGSGFVAVLLCPWLFWVLFGPAVGPGCLVCPWAAARPRDRHTRACGSERSISKPGQALPPPTGTAARPCRCPRAPQPGPAAAHGHRSQALRSLRCPSHLWGRVADRCVVSKAGLASPPPMGPQSGRADQAAGCLKPVSPVLMCGCVGLKPASPLRVRDGCFWCGFWVQW